MHAHAEVFVCKSPLARCALKQICVVFQRAVLARRPYEHDGAGLSYMGDCMGAAGNIDELIIIQQS